MGWVCTVYLLFNLTYAVSTVFEINFKDKKNRLSFLNKILCVGECIKIQRILNQPIILIVTNLSLQSLKSCKARLKPL